MNDFFQNLYREIPMKKLSLLFLTWPHLKLPAATVIMPSSFKSNRTRLGELFVIGSKQFLMEGSLILI